MSGPWAAELQQWGARNRPRWKQGEKQDGVGSGQREGEWSERHLPQQRGLQLCRPEAGPGGVSQARQAEALRGQEGAGEEERGSLRREGGEGQ